MSTKAYPIVYVRGYAMTQAEVEETFNRPYYGFNLGATQVKQGADETASMRIFESPVIRLLKEQDYSDSFGRYVSPTNEPLPGSVPAPTATQTQRDDEPWRKTLWIFRFYDDEAELFDNDRPDRDIESYAEKLWLFLHQVRQACGDPADFKVNLVAHSMGGLVSRCYLQCKDLTAPRLAGGQAASEVAVNKLFTYGTPHKGISFRKGLGWVEDVRDFFGNHGSDAFGETRMRQFLSLKDDQETHTYVPHRGGLPLDRIFCVVGTNYQDYVVWSAKKSVGPGSDGLVAIHNAYVKQASRAFIHRAHSGPLGMVNSEEGYQNLLRFLFGDVRYALSLEPLTARGELPGQGDDDTLDYLLVDVDMVLRGLSCTLHSRREANLSAMSVPMKDDGSQRRNKRTVLFTGFMNTEAKAKGDRYVRAAVRLRIEPHYIHDGLFRDSRFEGAAVLNDTLYLRIDTRNRTMGYRWGRPDDYQPIDATANGWTFPLPRSAERWLGGAGLRIDFAPWS